MTESSNQPAPPLNPWEIMATFGAAVMEISWIVLLYQAMGPATASDPIWMPFTFFLVVLVLTGVSTRVINQLRLSKGVERGMLVIYFGVAYLLGSNLLLQAADNNFSELFTQALAGLGDLTALIPGKAWLVIVLIWLVFRGYVFGRQGVGRFAVFSFFRLGVVMFLVYGLLSLANGRELPGIGMFTVFLSATLLAMTAARVSFLGRIRGGRRNPFTREWMGGIAGAVLGTVGTGFTLALMVVGRLQTLILFLVGIIITLGFAPLLFLLSLFMDVPIPEIAPPPPTPEGMVLPPTDLGPDLLDRTNQQVNALPDNLRSIVFIIGIILSVAVLVVFIWIVTASVRRMMGNSEVEYIAKRGDLVELLRKQAGEQLRQPGDWLAGRLQGRQRVQAAARIRHIYGDLLDLCAALDIPRPDSQTPLEFQKTILSIMPAIQRELSTITNAYLKVRYGELPETREEVLAVETAWEQVQQAGNTQKQIVLARKRGDEKELKLKEKR